MPLQGRLGARGWLRGNRGEEYPTLDPVELERRLIAESKAVQEVERRPPGWPILSRLAVLFTLLMVAAYLVAWATSVQSSGGPEGYVRRTDFLAILTGAQVLRDGNGPMLYDLDAQRISAGRIVGSGDASAFRP